MKQKRKIIQLDLMKFKKEQTPKLIACYHGLCDLEKAYKELLTSAEYYAVKGLSENPDLKIEVDGLIQLYGMFEKMKQFLEVELDKMKDVVNSLE